MLSEFRGKADTLESEMEPADYTNLKLGISGAGVKLNTVRL